jgi:hypothetical protein
MTGILPDSLPGKVRLFCIPGAVSAHLYYMIKDYFENNVAPDTLCLFIAPYHLEGHSTFWTEAVKYKFFHYNRFNSILERFREAGDPALGNPKKNRVKFWLYWMNVPYLYIPEIQNSLFRRAEDNRKTYSLLEKTGGYFPREKGNDPGGLNFEATDDEFIPSPVLDEYLRSILDMCLENDVFVFFARMPMTESSINAIKPGYKTAYREYIERLAADYPEFTMDKEFIAFPDSLFCDASHLDSRGCIAFTRMLRERLYPNFIDE